MWKSNLPSIIFLFSALLPNGAQAGLLVPHEDPKRPLEVRRARYEISVKNQVVEAVVRQVFFNQLGRASDATFLQRLPEGAAVSTFAFWVGKR
ncbi:MAG: hypothetical protein JRH20_28740, partial [Deltaproteobacteria bacterium]|nr:hypothetical protein [Deltaproteobacteria bacterium]